MKVGLTAVAAAAAILAIFPAAGWAQPQPKPLVNADIVKMVKAGIGEDTILLAIQSKPGSFDTSPEALIGLKQQGVTPAILKAMLGASPAAPAPPPADPPAAPPAQQAPPQQSQADQGSVGAWVGIYGVCPRNDLVVFKPTVYANQIELARLACNTFFYVAAQPGTYKFCATKGKCTTAEITLNGPFYFRVLPTTLSYSISPIDASIAEEQIARHNVVALDPGKVLAPKMVTMTTNSSPAVLLSAQ